MVNTAAGGAYHFKPHLTRVTVGGRVSWVLESGTHTATAYHPANGQPRLVPEGTEAWNSGTLSEPGQTFQHTFDVPGVYHYYCEPHERFGMLGTVIVGTPDPDEQKALETVPDGKPREVRAKLEELNEMTASALEGGHHEEGTPTESGHHGEGTHTESGHHREGTHTESGHHREGTHTESGHH